MLMSVPSIGASTQPPFYVDLLTTITPNSNELGTSKVQLSHIILTKEKSSRYFLFSYIHVHTNIILKEYVYIEMKVFL